MAKARIYKVVPKPHAALSPRLVRGISPAEVRNHVLGDTFTIEPASAEDVAAIMGADGDVKVEDVQASLPLPTDGGAQS